MNFNNEYAADHYESVHLKGIEGQRNINTDYKAALKQIQYPTFLFSHIILLKLLSRVLGLANKLGKEHAFV